MAAGDDGAEVVHHQQAADAVCGSRAAPQHDGEDQVVPRHGGDASATHEAASSFNVDVSVRERFQNLRRQRLVRALPGRQGGANGT